MAYSNPFGGYNALGIDFLEANPDAAYNQFTTGYGLQQYDPFIKNLMDQQDYWKNRYYATSAQPGKLGLKWTDYLNQISGDAGSMWSGMSPQQRGYRSSSLMGTPQFTFPK